MSFSYTLQILPDLRESRWEENSTAKITDGQHKGADAVAYSWIIEKDMGYGDNTAVYTFFMTKVITSSLDM